MTFVEGKKTMNYKWFRKLTVDEFERLNWSGVLSFYGKKPDQMISDFAPDLDFNVPTSWKSYENWWNKHFNTKLNRLLSEVE